MDQLELARSGVVDRYLRVDQNYYLPDDILYKTDRMSMAHSLEVRPPFLDHRIVEFAATLPAALEDSRVAAEVHPAGVDARKTAGAVLNRKKTGFDIPTHDWFRGRFAGSAAGHADR